MAVREKGKAVKILVEYMASLKADYKVTKIIRRLGDIGHKSAIPVLVKMSQGASWGPAKESYLSLAKIDNKKYGLTESQATFLKETRRRFKANRPTYIAHWKKLAELDKKEIRPFVMQMIAGDSPPEALIILQIWRDVESVPAISRLMQTCSRWQRRDFIAAYLNLEGTDKSIAQVVAMVKGKEIGSSKSHSEDAIRGVCQSIMSKERKLEVLRRFRGELGTQLVAKNLIIDSEWMETVLPVLMSEETDIVALGHYAGWAGRDSEKRFGGEVYDALEKLISLKTISSKQAYAARQILDACAAYKLEGAGKLTDKLLSDRYSINARIAAARVSATLGGDRKRAMELLYKELGNSNARIRQQSCGRVAKVKCLNEAERAEREQVALAHLGKESEDFAIRLLVTCAGDKSQEKLTSMLDGNDAGRALYAAWVLSQYPDENVKTKAIRRIAIYAMFNHNWYQQGSGIDFTIAREINFHQLTSSLNPKRSGSKPRPEPVVIPNELLVPFSLDKQEQAFAVLAYRHSRLEPYRVRFPQLNYHFGWRQRKPGWDVSHLTLLQVVASEDLHLSVLYVKGKKVAHFVNRKNAASIIAGITGKKASYKGLDGRDIDSGAVPPVPYENQNKLAAAFLLDLIESSGIEKRPIRDFEWKRLGASDRIIRNLVTKEHYGFGDELKEELIAQSRSRNVAMKLKAAGFSLWSNITE